MDEFTFKVEFSDTMLGGWLASLVREGNTFTASFRRVKFHELPPDQQRQLITHEFMHALWQHYPPR